MEPTPFSTVIRDARDTARDQLSAVWQLQVDRIQEELAHGWKQHIEKVFDDRFSELGAQLEGQFRSAVAEQVEAGISARSGAVRRELADRMNQALRRMRGAEDAAGFWQILADTCSCHAGRVAVFSVRGRQLHCEAARGFEDAAGLPGSEFDAASAPAFDSAIRTGEMVIAIRSAGELSEALMKMAGEAGPEKVFIYPVGNPRAIAGVIYVEQPVETSAIELISNAAAPPVETPVPAMAAEDLIRIGPAAVAAGKPAIPDWAALSAEDRELHMKAQRFARVQVAEIRLYKARAVKTGRAHKHLFDVLQAEIELARENFRRQYMMATTTMVDYLHQELVRTLANDDPTLLGTTYPGPLV